MSLAALTLALFATQAVADERKADAACPAADRAMHRSLAEQARIDVTPTQPALRRELLAMKRDGETTGNNQAGQDARTSRLRAIIRAQGFPGPDVVGVDGYKAAWLVVQHSVDPELQKAVLPDAHRWALRYKPLGQYYALLRDRLLVEAGDPQIFGTQLGPVPGKDGAVQPWPIAFPEKVDELRGAYGLMPLADYLCSVNEVMRR